MHVVLIKNPTVKKISLNLFDTNSWYICPSSYCSDISNTIKYSKLNSLGTKMLENDNIIGYDIDKMIYLSFNKFTNIQECDIPFTNISKGIYKVNYKLPINIVNTFINYDYIIIL